MRAAALSDGLQRCAELDRRLVEAVRGIRVLSTVAWPARVERRFLEDLQRGREALPRFDYRAPDLSAQRAELAAPVARQRQQFFAGAHAEHAGGSPFRPAL